MGWVGGVLRAVFGPARFRWWHAVGFGVMANVVSAIGIGRGGEDRGYYEGLRQAPFAPPSWVFGPAWTTNNISVLWGNLRLLNQPEGTPNRGALILMQGMSWFLYSTFGYVYFRRRSPVLAFAWTATFYVLTIASVLLSWRTDKKVTLSLATLLAWLTLATPVAAYQAARNPDELFGTRAIWR